MVDRHRDKGSSGPRYKWIADALMAQIKAGHFGPGQRLPSIRSLCRQHRVSIVTCERALRSLESRGLIFAVPRVGYYQYQHHAVCPQAGRPQAGRAATGKGRIIDWRCLLLNQDILSTINLAGFIPRSVLRPSFDEVMRAAPAPGDPALRAAIVRQLHLQGFGAHMDAVTVTDGSLAVVQHALHVLNRPGTVVVQAPLCPALAEILRLSARRVIELDMLSPSVVVHELLRVILDRGVTVAAAVIAPSCHPISGQRLTFKDSVACYRLCVEHDIPLIVDDSMRYLMPPPRLAQPFKAIDEADIVIQHASLVSFLTPGLPIGWVFGGRWHAALQASLARVHPHPPAHLQQIVAALFNHKRVLEGRVAVARECHRLVGFMADVVTTHCPKSVTLHVPHGGPHLCLRLPSGLAAESVCTAAADEGLLLNAGGDCSLTGLYRDCLVLGTNIDPDSMRQGARVLGHVLRRLAG